VISNVPHLEPVGTDRPFSRPADEDYSRKIILVNNEVSVFVTNPKDPEFIAIPSAVLKIFEEGLEMAYFKASNRQWKDWASKRILDLEKTPGHESQAVENGMVNKIKSAFGFLKRNPNNSSQSPSTSQVEKIASDMRNLLEECAESTNKVVVGYLREHLDEFVEAAKRIANDKPANGGQGKRMAKIRIC